MNMDKINGEDHHQNVSKNYDIQMKIQLVGILKEINYQMKVIVET